MHINDNAGNVLEISTIGGAMVRPYLYAIAEGDVTGHTPIYKLGYNAAVGTSEVEIWSKGNTAYAYPAATGIQMAVKSSDNTQDKAGGTGALTVVIDYLDETYAAKTTTVILNGTTEVNLTPAKVLRVNGFRVATTGSGGKPVGNLSLTNVGGTVTYSYITAGYTRARSSMYTVPLGKTLYVTSIDTSIAGAKYARIIGKSSYDPVSATTSTNGLFFMPFREVILLNGSNNKQLEMPLKFPEKTDIKFTAIAEAAGSLIVCDYRGWLE